jgi:hypothetical protein
MTAEQQVELINLLIRDEARRLGIPAAGAITTSAIDLADDAVDAITEGCPRPGDHIAAGDVVWQFKKPTPKWKRLEEDLKKSETARTYFRNGAGYSYIEGRRLAAPTRLLRARKLRGILSGVGCAGRVSFLTADDVAGWASLVPAAVFIIQPQTRGYFRADRLLQAPPHGGIEYQKDELRSSTIKEIRRRLFGNDPTALTARVVGPAGVGKTRLVLELLHEEGIADLALYAPNPPSSELFSWIEGNEDVEAVVVIDECNELEAERFETMIGLCAGRARLITIGPGSPQLRGSRTLSLNPLDDHAMERVVRSITTTLLPEQVHWIVEQTRGYAKLARAVTLGVARGAVDFPTLQNDDDIRRAIEKLVLPEDIPRRALSGLSLLTRVGWRDEVVDEAETITQFMGLSWEQMRFGVANAQGEGLVSTKGKYWYVSPEFLAATLAARVWTNQPDRVEELHGALPDRAKDALLERLAGLDIPGVRDVLARMLGGDGPFQDLDSLSNPQAGSLFAVLARGAPEAALQRLEEIIGYADHARLAHFTDGRRELLSALEFLASRSSTFRSAAKHLLALAEAENESYGNNASGLWQGLFRTFLGSTEASGEQRLELLTELLEFDSPLQQKLLAVGALGAALERQEIGFPLDSGATPPQRWRPVTWDEARMYKRAVVDLLLRSLQDPEPAIRNEAAIEAVSHTRALASIGLVDEAIRLLQIVLNGGEFDTRKIWEAARAIADQEKGNLSLHQAKELEGLAARIYGDSLSDRVRRYTARRSWVDWPGAGSAKERPEEIAAQLADEAFSDHDLLETLLPWLCSKEAEAVWPFGHRLGELDSERGLFQRIVEATRLGSSFIFLCAYLSGRSQAGDSDWVTEVIDHWSTSPDSSDLAAEATIRLRGSDHALKRLLSMIDEGRAEPSVLNLTSFGRWLERVNLDLQIEVVKRLSDIGAEGSEAALGIVHDLLARESPVPASVFELAWNMLTREETTSDTMSAFHWEEIARVLIDDSPERVTELVLNAFLRSTIKFYDRRLELLSTALDRRPVETWNVMARTLFDSDESYKLVWEMERVGTVDSIPLEVLEAWLSEIGHRGADLLAQATKPKPGSNDSLVDLLLKTFPDVAAQLELNYWTGSYSGPESLRMEELIREAYAWKVGSSDALRTWSSTVIENLEKQRDIAKAREELE